MRELFNFETISTLECSQALVEMVEISAAYHRTCAAILEELAPLLRAELGTFIAYFRDKINTTGVDVSGNHLFMPLMMPSQMNSALCPCTDAVWRRIWL